MIELKDVSKSYGNTTVLEDISFRIDPGEFVCITGPSGAGKSTLLHLLTGAEPVTSGSIEVDGVDINLIPPPAMQLYRRRVGIVFQDYKLLLKRTVAENIAFPLEVCGVDDDEIERRVEIALELIDLEKHADTLSSELSGGEKARVAIGRSIIHDPMIVLADEPTGNIDPDQSLKVIELFQQIHDSGTTIIIATHDAGLVDFLEPRVIELKDKTIQRDSVGTYTTKNVDKKSKKTSAGKHKILEEDEAEDTDASKVTVKPVK